MDKLYPMDRLLMKGWTKAIRENDTQAQWNLRIIAGKRPRVPGQYKAWLSEYVADEQLKVS